MYCEALFGVMQALNYYFFASVFHPSSCLADMVHLHLALGNWGKIPMAIDRFF
jgi:hypothetical protein